MAEESPEKLLKFIQGATDSVKNALNKSPQKDPPKTPARRRCFVRSKHKKDRTTQILHKLHRELQYSIQQCHVKDLLTSSMLNSVPVCFGDNPAFADTVKGISPVLSPEKNWTEPYIPSNEQFLDELLPAIGSPQENKMSSYSNELYYSTCHYTERLSCMYEISGNSPQYDHFQPYEEFQNTMICSTNPQSTQGLHEQLHDVASAVAQHPFEQNGHYLPSDLFQPVAYPYTYPSSFDSFNKFRNDDSSFLLDDDNIESDVNSALSQDNGSSLMSTDSMFSCDSDVSIDEIIRDYGATSSSDEFPVLTDISDSGNSSSPTTSQLSTASPVNLPESQLTAVTHANTKVSQLATVNPLDSQLTTATAASHPASQIATLNPQVSQLATANHSVTQLATPIIQTLPDFTSTFLKLL